MHPAHRAIAPSAHRPATAARRALPAGLLRLAPAALAAALALGSAPAGALDVFTGNRPVYVGSWYDGSSMVVQQFQFAADWASWCNVHIGANCQSIAFWNVAANWDRNQIPVNDARVELGQTVRVGDFQSWYLGTINGYAAVNTLSAAGRVEISGGLTVANAQFGDLHAFIGGALTTTGLSTVLNLSSGLGDFYGTGITQLQGWQPSTLGTLAVSVHAGHRMQLAADAPGIAMAIRLDPTAQLENLGTLRVAGGSIGLQGTANLLTLPTFTNIGQMVGSVAVSGVRFNNNGTVALPGGARMSIGEVGTHTGLFTAAADTALSFGGLTGPGHTFAAGSGMFSQDLVTATRGNHHVLGAWNVARQQVENGGRLSFDGPSPTIGELIVSAHDLNIVAFNGGAGVQLTAARVDGGRVEFNAGDNRIAQLTLNGGVVAANAPLVLDSSFTWASGTLGGGARIDLADGTQLVDGLRRFGATDAHLAGRMDWNAGHFESWGGNLAVDATGQVLIHGDFNAGGSGNLSLAGQLRKTAGAGRAELRMNVGNFITGSIEARTGTLALLGGSTHLGGQLIAAPGAFIELAGPTVIGWGATLGGDIDVVGGSFTLLDNTQFSAGAGRRFEVSDLTLSATSTLTLPGNLVATGQVRNAGLLQAGGTADVGSHLTNSGELRLGGLLRVAGNLQNTGVFNAPGPVSVVGDFNQQGDFSMAPGHYLLVNGAYTNGKPLTLTDTDITVGRLNNPSSLAVQGRFFASVGHLDNAGTLSFLPTQGNLVFSTGNNWGTLRLDGAAMQVQHDGEFITTGQVFNEGDWQAGGSFAVIVGGRFDNAGQLALYADAAVGPGSVLNNSGTVTFSGVAGPPGSGITGTFNISAGGRLEGTGLYRQTDGTTVVNGLLRADQGVQIEGGLIKGLGSVAGPLWVGPFARSALGTSPGTLTVQGDFTLDGQLEVEIDSLALHDRLVVSGAFNAGYGSAIDLVFGPGYTPQDGDAVNWLQAGSSSLNGVVNATGLPADWRAGLDADGQVMVTYDLALPIPLSGDHRIHAGEMAYHAPTGGFAYLNRLDNDGSFSLRPGAGVSVGTLQNNGASTNRGTLWVSEMNNAGRFTNQAGAVVEVFNLGNTGTLALGGQTRVTGQLHNQAGGRIDVPAGGQLTLAGDYFRFNRNDGTLRVAGTLEFNELLMNGGSFTVQAGGTVRGLAGSTSPGTYRTQDANAVTTVDGLLQADLIDLNNSRLDGTGTLRGTVQADYATIAPGHSPGTLTIDGDLHAGLGTLELELDSAAAYDRLVVSGNAEIGNVRFVLPVDFRPVAGDRFAVLGVAGALTGGGVVGSNWWVEAQDPWGGTYLWGNATSAWRDHLHPDAAPVRLSFANGVLSVTAVPEPGTWALLLAGLLAVGAWQRRRPAAG